MKSQAPEKSEPVLYRGQYVSTIQAKEVPPNYKSVAFPFKVDHGERELFESAWDLLKGAETLLARTVFEKVECVEIFRDQSCLDPWCTGGYTGDDDKMRVSIGLREGLNPALSNRLVKDICCFVKA